MRESASVEAAIDSDSKGKKTNNAITVLQKIKLMIGEQMDILSNDFFNQKLESLNRRVEQLQCKKTHEEIAKTFLKKVSKLERRINAVIAFQEEVFSKLAGHWMAYVQNPKGIALSWTLTEIDPKCFPTQLYHLYLFHENLSNNSASLWKKIGKIRALPLIGCCLSQVLIPKKYYFVIQKDICGRYRPFCDVQSLTP
ncbi:LOW QUALITY PROTEIN: activating transcription factor 7-interacting protein 2 [Phoenicopterus ruber ruber]